MKRTCAQCDEVKHEQQTINKDIWTVIVKFDMNILLVVLRTSRAYYTAFGGVANILKFAFALKNDAILTCGAQTALPLETLLHPLQWQLINKCQIALTSLQLISMELQQYPILQRAFDGSQDGPVLAGGFARSVVLSAFRRLNPKMVHSELLTDCDDIDLFYANVDSIQKASTNFAVKKDEKHNGVYEWINNVPFPNNISNTHKLQLIVISLGLQASSTFNHKGLHFPPPDLSSKIIQGFDYTCTQVAFHGNVWWRDLHVTVTPAFLYSLFTGRMYMSFFHALETAWPFVDLDTTHLDLTRRSHQMICCAHKKIFLARLLKYQKRGYKDALLTQDSIDAMTQFPIALEKTDHDEDYARHFDFLLFLFGKK